MKPSHWTGWRSTDPHRKNVRRRLLTLALTGLTFASIGLACSDEESEKNATPTTNEAGVDTGTDARNSDPEDSGSEEEEDVPPVEFKVTSGVGLYLVLAPNTPGLNDTASPQTVAFLGLTTAPNELSVCGTNAQKASTPILRISIGSPGSSIAVGTYTLSTEDNPPPPFMHAGLTEYDATCTEGVSHGFVTGKVVVKSKTATEFVIDVDGAFPGGFVKTSLTVPVCAKTVSEVQTAGKPACN